MSDDSDLSSGSQEVFFNPILDAGADPWVVYHDGYYYRIFADGVSSMYVAKAQHLHKFNESQNIRIWHGPAGTNHGYTTWAPELHFLDGKWYVYFAASGGDAQNQRMFVLESRTQDPLGEYDFKGEITPYTERWGIDGTVLELDNGERYYLWSGWEGHRDYQQNLYIARMESPWSLVRPRQEVRRYEAEAATINNAQVRQSGEASAGQAVGFIDFVDSFVEFQVEVARAGRYTIDVRYSNGTPSESTHRASVNGREVQQVRYAPTTNWENWQIAHLNVELNPGVNMVRLGKGLSYAELDAIEVKEYGTDRMVLTSPDRDWERRGGPPFVAEGPQILKRNGKIHVIYSASGSWTDDYALGRLTFLGGDIMDRNSWEKVGPVFHKSESNQVYGTGHASFTQSRDGQEDWIVYHAAIHKGAGWTRNVRIQRFGWDGNDNPIFGVPKAVSEPIQVPSGTY